MLAGVQLDEEEDGFGDDQDNVRALMYLGPPAGAARQRDEPTSATIGRRQTKKLQRFWGKEK